MATRIISSTSSESIGEGSKTELASIKPMRFTRSSDLVIDARRAASTTNSIVSWPRRWSCPGESCSSRARSPLSCLLICSAHVSNMTSMRCCVSPSKRTLISRSASPNNGGTGIALAALTRFFPRGQDEPSSNSSWCLSASMGWSSMATFRLNKAANRLNSRESFRRPPRD